jgi:hypothetical protein
VATQLKNIITFTAVGAGSQATLPHGLNVDGQGTIPDKIEFDNGEFSYVSADATDVTVQNDGAAPASVNVLCEHWHTFERVFGATSVTALTPQPFVVEGEGASSSVPNPLILTDGDPVIAAPATSGVVVAEGAASGGTEDFNLAKTGFASGFVGAAAGGSASIVNNGYGGFASGRAVANTATGVASIETTGHGGFAFGDAHTDLGALKIEAQRGALAFGVSYPGTGYSDVNQDMLIRAGHGGFAGGYIGGSRDQSRITTESYFGPVYAAGNIAFGSAVGWYGGMPAYLESHGDGSMAVGRVLASLGPSYIRATDTGSIALGEASTGRLLSSERGAFASGVAVLGQAMIRTTAGGSRAHGYARDAGTYIQATAYGAFAIGEARAGGEINAIDRGAFAQGRVQGIYEITASADGAHASGFASGGDVVASGNGAFAHGAASTGNIAASAANAVQFGEGTNALADSLQVGSAGLRLKGTTGAPGAAQNGDFWVAGGYVYVQTNGAPKKL